MGDFGWERSRLVTVVERAFRIAREGVPGPVFIEVPVDLLYDEETVRGWYFKETGVDRAKDVGSKVLKLYLERHLNKVFKPGPHPEDNPVLDVRALDPDPEALEPILKRVEQMLEAGTSRGKSGNPRAR